ncbi:MAG: hypothetical protein U1F33_12535 [Alphaproteobacteria bacterium]
MDKSSCIAHEPLSKLEDNGSASVLNYNLPQSTTYAVVSLIKLDIPLKSFKESERQPTPGNYWERFDVEAEKQDVTPGRIQSVLNARSYSGVDEIMSAGLNFTAAEPSLSSGVRMKAANIQVSTKSASFATEYAANKIAEGFRPQLYRRPSGKQGLVFQPRPKGARPAIYLVMKMRMASYLGDYGAGQTLSTFSLLPGEKTVIQIRDYRHDETTQSSSQSVLDSYSETAMEDLQTTIEASTTTGVESSDTDTDSMSVHAGYGVGIDLGIVKLGEDIGGEASSVNTSTEAVSQQVSTLNNAVDHHVQTADTQRQIQIDTDVTSTAISETETTTTRTLENINRSRVLNFVFRQLLQEYFTLTYLDDVSLMYSNGYDTSRKTGSLSSMGALLKSVLIDAKTVESVRNDIYVHLCNIVDYTGTRVSFIEKAVERQVNCIDPSQPERPVAYVRKRKDLAQSYGDKTVNGIILDVTHRVMRTPAVIVEALLGQGGALDCYNEELQEAAVIGAQLANKKIEQALALIDAIADPSEKARLYNNVFGTCCSTPQTAPPDTGT